MYSKSRVFSDRPSGYTQTNSIKNIIKIIIIIVSTMYCSPNVITNLMFYLLGSFPHTMKHCQISRCSSALAWAKNTLSALPCLSVCLSCFRSNGAWGPIFRNDGIQRFPCWSTVLRNNNLGLQERPKTEHWPGTTLVQEWSKTQQWPRIALMQQRPTRRTPSECHCTPKSTPFQSCM
jgi:hypothetical protein